MHANEYMQSVAREHGRVVRMFTIVDGTIVDVKEMVGNLRGIVNLMMFADSDRQEWPNALHVWEGFTYTETEMKLL